jgi:hypothetical protein
MYTIHTGEPMTTFIVDTTDFTPVRAYRLAALIRKEVPELEAIISQDAGCSTDYAIEVINKPFPLGEPVIATSIPNTLKYVGAFGVRLPAAETLILESTYVDVYDYATACNMKLAFNLVDI